LELMVDIGGDVGGGGVGGVGIDVGGVGIGIGRFLTWGWG